MGVLYLDGELGFCVCGVNLDCLKRAGGNGSFY